MKTFTLLLIAGLSTQMPARDTAPAEAHESRPCTEQHGGAYSSAEQGRYSPLAAHYPTI